MKKENCTRVTNSLSFQVVVGVTGSNHITISMTLEMTLFSILLATRARTKGDHNVV